MMANLIWLQVATTKYGKNVQNTIKMTDKLFKCYFLSLPHS